MITGQFRSLDYRLATSRPHEFQGRICWAAKAAVFEGASDEVANGPAVFEGASDEVARGPAAPE